jgi:integrase
MSGYLKENKDKNGKIISFRIGAPRSKDTITGKYRYAFRTVKTDSIRIARKKLIELQAEINKGTYIEPGKQTLKEYLETWLKDIAFPNMTPHNYEGYEFNINKYIIPAVGNVTLSQLSSQHIQHVIATKQSEKHFRTAQYIYYAFNKSLNAAVKMGLLARNPVNGVEAPKVPEHEMQTMSQNDMHIFLEYARKGPYYALFYTDLFTGMRRSELLALQWKDVDLLLMQISVNRTIHVMRYGTYKGQVIYKQPKTAKSRRLISLSPSTCAVLQEHWEAQNKQRESLNLPILTENDLVLCNYDGTPYLPDGISHAWMKLARRTGLKGIRLHDARHTHASLMLKQGIHPKIVQERLGHTSIETTLDTYSHVAPGLQQMAAAKFDEIALSKESKLDKDLKEVAG